MSLLLNFSRRCYTLGSISNFQYHQIGGYRMSFGTGLRNKGMIRELNSRSKVTGRINEFLFGRIYTSEDRMENSIQYRMFDLEQKFSRMERKEQKFQDMVKRQKDLLSKVSFSIERNDLTCDFSLERFLDSNIMLEEGYNCDENYNYEMAIINRNFQERSKMVVKKWNMNDKKIHIYKYNLRNGLEHWLENIEIEVYKKVKDHLGLTHKISRNFGVLEPYFKLRQKHSSIEEFEKEKKKFEEEFIVE